MIFLLIIDYMKKTNWLILIPKLYLVVKVIRMTSLVLSLLLFSGKIWADVILASPFKDHMVLQRDMPVPVWGTAAAGEKIRIVFGNQTKNVIADFSGKWMVKLNKLKAGGPFVLNIYGNNTVTVSDVYVGEVWLCSGQSNMDMTVAKEDRYWCGVYNEAEEVAAANYRRGMDE